MDYVNARHTVTMVTGRYIDAVRCHPSAFYRKIRMMLVNNRVLVATAVALMLQARSVKSTETLVTKSSSTETQYRPTKTPSTETQYTETTSTETPPTETPSTKTPSNETPSTENATTSINVTAKISYENDGTSSGWTRLAVFALHNYAPPIIVPCGFVGNVLSFLVCVQRHNRRISCFVYMAALAIIDNIALFLLGLHWYGKSDGITEDPIQPDSHLICKLGTYILFVVTTSGVVTVLAMTVDRLIATNWPLHASSFCRSRRALLVLAVAFPIILTYDIPYLFHSKSIEVGTGRLCSSFSEPSTLASVYIWLNPIINCLLPFVGLLTMNTAIFLAVHRSRKSLRTQYTDNSSPTALSIDTTCSTADTNFSTADTNFSTASTSQISIVSSTSITTPPRSQGPSKSVSQRDNQLAVMLAVVTLSFLVLTLPIYLKHIATYYVQMEPHTAVFIYHLVTKIFYLNNALNFYLYCITGAKFRNDLKNLLTFSCCKNNN